MKLAVSSIAWANEEETQVAEKLKSLGIKYVELAPTKIWVDPTKTDIGHAKAVTEWWSQYGIEVVAFQSILFARPDLKIFQDDENRVECLEYVKDFTRLAGKMGVGKIVFGSPKNRQRGEMSASKAFNIAKDFFTEVAKTAQENDVVFCIEPNAKQYSCDFVTNAEEGANLVEAVNHPGFGLHLDTACMALAGDDLAESIKRYSKLIQHFHISSPMLEQVDSRVDVNHEGAADALKSIGYNKFISIEMRPAESGLNVKRVEKAVHFAQSTYLP